VRTERQCPPLLQHGSLRSLGWSGEVFVGGVDMPSRRIWPPTPHMFVLKETPQATTIGEVLIPTSLIGRTEQSRL
jgi:hypothetical protein